MDINELKNLIKSSTAVLVLDSGEPSFVLIGYDAYKNLVADKKSNEEKEIKINPVRSSPSTGPLDRVSAGETSNEINQSHNGAVNSSRHFHEKESEILERLNKEILALKNQIEMEEKGLTGRLIDPAPFER